MVIERKYTNSRSAYGAKIILITKEEGGFVRCVQETKEKANEINEFLANQFANENNFLAHYGVTGKEIIEQLPKNVSAFFSGVGTRGTLMGIGKR